MEADRPSDLVRTVLQLIALGILSILSFLIVRPFLISLIWAIMIAVSTWPLLLRVQGWVGGRRSLAVALLTLALLLMLVAPLTFGISALVGSGEAIARWSRSLETFVLPPPPGWVATLPMFGARIAEEWRKVAAARPEELIARLSPYVRPVLLWFARQVGSVGLLLVQFLLSVVLVGILYANGESVVRGADLLARRVAGPRGVKTLHLASHAIRAVALGVVVTAIFQAAVGGIGLAVAGVPFAAVLMALIFMLSVAQIGAGPVLIPAVIWVYAKSGIAWGTGLLVWSIFCMTSDNLLRPLLIKRGADLPLLLIFAGVLGGLVAFGILGIFIGPMVLAVVYTLLVDWVSEEPSGGERETAPPQRA